MILTFFVVGIFCGLNIIYYLFILEDEKKTWVSYLLVLVYGVLLIFCIYFFFNFFSIMLMDIISNILKAGSNDIQPNPSHTGNNGGGGAEGKRQGYPNPDKGPSPNDVYVDGESTKDRKNKRKFDSSEYSSEDRLEEL